MNGAIKSHNAAKNKSNGISGNLTSQIKKFKKASTIFSSYLLDNLGPTGRSSPVALSLSGLPGSLRFAREDGWKYSFSVMF
jgi:hypothetical protein